MTNIRKQIEDALLKKVNQISKDIVSHFRADITREGGKVELKVVNGKMQLSFSGISDGLKRRIEQYVQRYK